MTQIPDGQNETDKTIVQAKRQLEKLMIQFHQFMEEKMLPENKSQGQNSAETDLANRVLQAANELDVAKYPEPEGTFTLFAVLIHMCFIMRDKNNRLDYKQEMLQQEIKKLKTQIMDLGRAGQRAP